jgi:virginiamycin B lyase
MNRIVHSTLDRSILGAVVLSAFFLCSEMSAQGPVQLPEGPGKQILETRCTLCHELSELKRVSFDREDWQELVGRMVTYGAPLSQDQIPVLVDYLGKNFATAGRQPGKVVPGPVEATVREFTLPNPGTRPNGTFLARDGSLWYSWAGSAMLGRYDPKTGQFKDFPLDVPGDGAHDMVDDSAGNIWFTAPTYIGALDPKTGDVREYRMPDSKAQSLHEPIFDQKGILWFTMSRGDMVGRLDPKTGDVKLISIPTKDSRLYGIAISSKGVPYFSLFAHNKLGSVDPVTFEVKEYTIPNPASRPKRIRFTSDDVLWYADYSRGYLGAFDTKTGKFREWPSPGGPTSHPYAITTNGDIVWYSEGRMKPPMIVRFDPKTEKFQTFKTASSSSEIHFMTPAPNGNIWFGRNTGKGGVLNMVEVRSAGRQNGQEPTR